MRPARTYTSYKKYKNTDEKPSSFHQKNQNNKIMINDVQKSTLDLNNEQDLQVSNFFIMK